VLPELVRAKTRKIDRDRSTKVKIKIIFLGGNNLRDGLAGPKANLKTWLASPSF
jgi:hypothetical protein